MPKLWRNGQLIDSYAPLARCLDHTLWHVTRRGGNEVDYRYISGPDGEHYPGDGEVFERLFLGPTEN